MKSAGVPALQIANWLVKLAIEHGDGLTHLKLQKLLYYAQAWHIVLYGEKLFDEKIEAWVHGPAVPSVYVQFKDFSFSPITPSDCRLPPIPKRVKKHLLDILQAFGGYSAYQLELMTHAEFPWKNARQGLAPDESSHNEISLKSMESYYSKMKNEQEAQKR